MQNPIYLMLKLAFSGNKRKIQVYQNGKIGSSFPMAQVLEVRMCLSVRRCMRINKFWIWKFEMLGIYITGAVAIFIIRKLILEKVRRGHRNFIWALWVEIKDGNAPDRIHQKPVPLAIEVRPRPIALKDLWGGGWWRWWWGDKT